MADYNKIRIIGSDGIPITIDLTASGNVLQVAQMQLVNAGITASKPLKLDADKKLTSGDINLESEVTGNLPYSAMNIADGDLTIAKTSGLQTALDNKLETSLKGAANGLAELDSGGKVPVTQLPNSIMEYLGTWAASTNTPTLADGTGNAGDVYIASDAGTVDFGSGNITFAQGDWVIYNGSTWEKSVNSNAVASVNGQTGVVVLDTDDISEGSTNKYYSSTLFDSDFSGKDTDDLAEGATNKYYSSTLFDSDFSGKDTDDLTEGATNKYYSSTLFDADFGAADLADLATKSHTSLTDIGTNSHSAIDTHIADSTKHFTMLDEDDMATDSDTQAATQQSIKAYVASQIAASSPSQVEFAGVAGEAFEANKTHVVRYAINGEDAGKIYKADSDHENNPGEYFGIGVIQTSDALVADDPCTVIVIGELNLKSGDSNFAAATDDGKPLFLNKVGAFSVDPDAGISSGDAYGLLRIGMQVSYNATVTSSKLYVNCSPANASIDLGA